MILGMLLVPLMDGTAKILVADYPVAQVVWGRYAFNLLTLLPLFLLLRQRLRFSRTRFSLQLSRALFLLGDTALFFAALFFIPLANGKAVFFASPLIMTALAPLMLGERVGRHRWAAVLIGFTGTLFILKPEASGLSIGYALALGSAFLYALYLLMTRKLSSSAPPLMSLLYTALFGTLIMSLFLPFHWVMPDGRGWALLVATGALGTISHFCIIKALEIGSASQLAPFSYAEIISATLFGLVVFGNFPDMATWTGISIVVASGLYILHRENRRQRPEQETSTST